MEYMLRAYRGCLLGLAIGDAMGCAVDSQSWDEIREVYGPNGLLGYDLQTGDYAEASSYTQIAAFLCNGLLLSVSRGKAAHLRFGKLALQEWARSQQFYRDPEESLCWIGKLPQFRRRNCRDARMLNQLRLEAYGAMDNPENGSSSPGAITAAVAVGMFYNPKRMAAEHIGTLTGALIALTHDNPEAFLSGVVLAYTVAGILQEPDCPLQEQFLQAIAVMDGQFGSRFSQAECLARRLRGAIALANSGTVSLQEGMEQLTCLDAAECLAGAMFACLSCPEDFDRAIITAVNHSGLSGAVGAITGAILGAKLTSEGLPEFYLESLETCQALEILAEDLVSATPTMGIFDDSWDHKYVQGLPPEGII